MPSVVRTLVRRAQVVALALAIAPSLSAFAPAVAATVHAVIDLSSQRMTVSVGGSAQYVWPVSTGRKGYSTPTGSYRPTRLHRKYFSRKYDNSPMPYSIFFRGGYAIHGTGYTKQLGRRASHGCIRLHPSNAARLFSLVQAHGRGKTRITIRQ